jgi:hypothetical protein
LRTSPSSRSAVLAMTAFYDATVSARREARG